MGGGCSRSGRGQPILADENTIKGLPAGIAVEELGPVQFKGKQQAVTVFSVIR